MPIDPRSYFISVPQTGGPMDVYRDYMSLRDLMDQRRYRDLQVRKYEQEEQERQRKLQAQERLRSALQTLPADADAMTMLRHLGPEGLPLVKELEDARTAGLTRQTSATNLQKTQQELSREQRKTALNDLASIMSMPDSDLKGQAFMEWQGKNQSLKLPVGRGVDWPLTPQGFEFAYKSALGPDEWRKREAEIAKAEQERTMNPLQIAEQRAKTARAQQELTGQALPSPSAAPALFNQWLAGWFAKTGLPDTPENRKQAIDEWIIANRPQFATPGVDIPKPPEVVQQDINKQVEIARRTAEATAGSKPMSAEGAKVLTIAETMVPELQALHEAIRTGGRAAIAGIVTRTNPRLRKLAENVADKVGRLRSGGAVNPAEEERFMGQISRASDLALPGGVEAVLDAIKGVISEAERVEGYMKPGSKQAGPGAGNRYQKGSDPMNLGIK